VMDWNEERSCGRHADTQKKPQMNQSYWETFSLHEHMGNPGAPPEPNIRQHSTDVRRKLRSCTRIIRIFVECSDTLTSCPHIDKCKTNIRWMCPTRVKWAWLL
jgi:hypothetical protein